METFIPTLYEAALALAVFATVYVLWICAVARKAQS